MKKNKSKILSDHKKVKSKFIPPLLSIGPKIEFSKFDRDIVPEIIWIALLLEAYDLRKVNKIFENIGEFWSTKEKVRFITISEMELINDEEWLNFILFLKEKALFNQIKPVLNDFLYYFSENKMSVFFEVTEPTQKIDIFVDKFEQILKNVSKKTSKESAYLQVSTIYLANTQGKLMMSKESVPNFESIVNYPDTDESQMTASWLRSTINIAVMMEKEANLPWLNFFWSRCLELSKTKGWL